MEKVTRTTLILYDVGFVLFIHLSVLPEQQFNHLNTNLQIPMSHTAKENGPKGLVWAEPPEPEIQWVLRYDTMITHF